MTDVSIVATPHGDARLHRDRSRHPVATLLLGHGAGGGVEAVDLAALAASLPRNGISVVRVEQPWRVAGKKVAPAPKTLDTGWRGLWPALARPGLPVTSSRSARPCSQPFRRPPTTRIIRCKRSSRTSMRRRTSEGWPCCAFYTGRFAKASKSRGAGPTGRSRRRR